MGNSPFTPGVAANRLAPEVLAKNFDDLHAPFDRHEAAVASDRCYFCYDAPCVTACPTAIDIPLFIRQISTGTPEAAAKTIFEQNILGGMCARVCPTETLCEEACVREAAEGKPVEIGRLQRYATDTMMTKPHPFARVGTSGKKIAVVGAGPAGLACAHRLAMKGHDVVIFEARPKAGGLNEYGIASYKAVGGFAQAEVDWLLQIGGIEIRYGVDLGASLGLDSLPEDFDAVFMSVGLAGVQQMDLPGETGANALNAVDFIAGLRQADDLSSLGVGRNVVVIGGGMTAVDAAVQAKLLGAQNVTIAYRRGQDRMAASPYEQDLAASKGVRILTDVMPIALRDGALELEYTRQGAGGLEGTGETLRIEADQMFKAIGQRFDAAPAGLALEGGKIKVDAKGRSSVHKVWAGGDCATGGDDLTVTAVAEGRDAAEDIHAFLS